MMLLFILQSILGVTMYSLKINGFKTKSQAEAFIQWYEGQGEQDASVWFGERQHDGQIDVDFMPVDCQKTYPLTWKDNILEAELKIE